jgi:eukaryotic-like serine/threonine-protein kinase
VRTGELVAGRYRLKEEAGSGGMGEVWRAVDEQDVREVALKRATRGADADSERTRRQLQREARNAAKLNHPNIVAFIEEAAEGPERWLVMEYVPSQSLAQILDRAGALGPQYVTHIGAQIAGALEAVHAQGILHRDVKPGNILVTRDGTAKLTDFGISRSICGDVTADSVVVGGTVAFMAPEVAGGEDTTRASDIFSLGATLFKAVEGTPPFGDADNPRLTLRHATAYKLLPVRRAGPLTSVLAALLQRDPAKRPDAAAVREMLQELAATLTDDGRFLSWPLRNPRRPWRFRRRALVAAGTCLAAPLIVVGMLAALPDDPPLASPLPADDPRSADPCALTDTDVLARFGGTSRDTARGNFNRCDVIVRSGSGSKVDVEVELEPRAPAETTIDGAGPVHVGQPPRDGDSCVRTLQLSGQNQVTNRVTITAKQEFGPRSEDLCAMSEAATIHAVAVLSRGTIPQRSAPFNRASLAWVNACGLLDRGDLIRVLGDGVGSPEIGFGDWHCLWTSTTSKLSVALFFDRDKLSTPTNGRPEKIGGRDAHIIPKSDKPECEARVTHRPDTNGAGKLVNELLRVEVRGPQPSGQLCGPAKELGAAAVRRLSPR